MNSKKYINRQEFVDNPTKRIPVCIVVDISGSMCTKDNEGVQRIQRVNDGIKEFYKAIRSDIKTKRTVDVSIIRAGNEPTIISEFRNTEHSPSRIDSKHNEGCDITSALKLALHEIDLRKEIYKVAKIDYYQPWILIMSDGGLSTKFSRTDFEEIQEDIRNRELNNKLVVFPLYAQEKPRYNSIEGKWETISEKTYEKRKNVMEGFTNFPERVISIDLADTDSFKKFFKFLHGSASSVASNRGFINNPEYGNFTNNNLQNNEIQEVYHYDQEENYSQNNYNGDNSDFELSHEINEEQEREKQLIEQARKELNKNTNINVSSNPHATRNRLKIEFFINGEKVFPDKRHDNDNIIFTFQIKKDDMVSIKNDSEIIYNHPFHSNGIYRFIIDTSKNISESCVKVSKISDIKNVHEKNQIIDDMNQEVKEIINNISNWNKI